jgi:hypothetical protein
MFRATFYTIPGRRAVQREPGTTPSWYPFANAVRTEGLYCIPIFWVDCSTKRLV